MDSTPERACIAVWQGFLNCSASMNICPILMYSDFMNILQRLVDSDSKVKLLGKLFERLNSTFSVSELGRLADIPKASVSNIVIQWQETGLVLSKQQGRNKLVFINTKFYLLPELKRIFEKTRNFQKPLMEELNKMPSLKNRGIKAVIVFGSRLRKDFAYSSDFDVLVVLDDKNSKVSERIIDEFVEATNKTGISFSPVILDEKNFRNRWKEKDRFITNILTESKIIKGGKWIEHIQAAR